jgi:hypothetical protein
MMCLFTLKTASLFRLVCFAICFGFIITTIPISLHQRAYGLGGSRRMQGPPIPTDLPNLDELRSINPGTPKAPPPVPATKCRGRDEKCKQKVKRAAT